MTKNVTSNDKFYFVVIISQSLKIFNKKINRTHTFNILFAKCYRGGIMGKEFLKKKGKLFG